MDRMNQARRAVFELLITAPGSPEALRAELALVQATVIITSDGPKASGPPPDPHNDQLVFSLAPADSILEAWLEWGRMQHAAVHPLRWP